MSQDRDPQIGSLGGGGHFLFRSQQEGLETNVRDLGSLGQGSWETGAHSNRLPDSISVPVILSPRPLTRGRETCPGSLAGCVLQNDPGSLGGLEDQDGVGLYGGKASALR